MNDGCVAADNLFTVLRSLTKRMKLCELFLGQEVCVRIVLGSALRHPQHV